MTSLRARPAGPPATSIRPGGGVGRSSSAYAESVSDAMRRLDSPHLRARRQASALTLGALGCLGVVAAYQTGLVRRVPEPRLPGFDADRVDASGEAYRLFGTPDSALGLASYAVTLALVAAGPADRATAQPWLPLLAAGKVVADAVSGTYLFAEQVTRHRALCSWCTVAAAANLVAVPVVLPEAAAAWRALRSGR